MVITKPGSIPDITNEEHEINARAKRITNVDANGNIISSTNPLPVTGVTAISTDLEGNGKVAVGTTPVQLTFTGVTESILITADQNNTGIIYVGKSDVDSSGNNAIIFLLATDNIVLDYEDSSNAIYVVSDTAAQNVWIGATK